VASSWIYSLFIEMMHGPIHIKIRNCGSSSVEDILITRTSLTGILNPQV